MSLGINASDQAAKQAPRAQHLVTINRPGTRTKTGGVHEASRRSIIRQARTENPQYADAAVREIFWGTEDSKDTVLRFDPEMPRIYGM